MTDRVTASLAPSGYSPARAFSLFSLSVLCGALLASFNSHPVVTLLVALLPLLLRPLCLWPLKVATTLSLALVLSFAWAVVRKDNSGPAQNDLYFVPALHSNSRVHLSGQIEEVRERESSLEPKQEPRLEPRQKAATGSAVKHDFSLIVRADELLYPTRRPLEGKVLVTVEAVDSESLPSPLPGDSVEISGLLRKPKGKNFSFEFDEAAWLASKGIFARLSVKAENFHIVAAQPTDCLDTREKVRGETALVRLNRAIDVVRKKIVVAHSEHLGGARGSLFSSMVLGDRVVSVDQELKQQFALIGLSHLLAASGLNLTIIVTAALVLCRFFQAKARPSQVARSGWLNIYVPFLCVVLFTAFAGAGPSVSRAAIMCLVALWARLAFVRLAHGAALALALLFALALDPVSVSDVGLQLSYGATFGIVYIYPLIESAWLEDIERVWLRAVFSLVAVVVAAQLAVLPIQLHVFQQLSVLVVPANLLAEPVVVPLTIMGFISSILAAVAACQLPQSFYFCQPLIDTAAVLCFAIDWLAKFPLDWLIYLARTLSLIPFVSLSVAKPQAAHIFLYYLLMALVLVGGRARPRIACLVLFITFAFLAAVSYVESPLLQLLCTERELIVNRGNLEYFVCPLNKQGQPFPSSRLGSQLGQSSHLGRLARLDQSERAQTAIGRSYVRYLLAKGIHIAPAPLVGEQLILEREALKIEIVGANFARSGLPCLQLITLPAPNSASGPYKLVCQPTRQGPVYCRLSGEVCSPLFIPYCSAPMPFAFPLIAEVEAVKSAYLVSLRL